MTRRLGLWEVVLRGSCTNAGPVEADVDAELHPKSAMVSCTTIHHSCTPLRSSYHLEEIG